MSQHAPHGPYEHWVKRPLDAVLAGAALALLSPVMLATAALVRVKLGSPVFFAQDRPGKDERVFKLYKFRTMTDERDEAGELLPDERRLTPFGKALRSTSIDELPELINIVKGDMAIVGPRPLLVRYLPYYTKREHGRHDVRPGLTGYAQVHGRNYVTWEKRFEMDLHYVDNVTFAGDLRLLFETIIAVFKRENIETASAIIHDGIVYRPLDVERQECCGVVLGEP